MLSKIPLMLLSHLMLAGTKFFASASIPLSSSGSDAEQQVATAISAVTTAGETILAGFGHTNWAAAVAEFSQLAPVGLALFDAVKGIIKGLK